MCKRFKSPTLLFFDNLSLPTNYTSSRVNFRLFEQRVPAAAWPYTRLVWNLFGSRLEITKVSPPRPPHLLRSLHHLSVSVTRCKPSAPYTTVLWSRSPSVNVRNFTSTASYLFFRNFYALSVPPFLGPSCIISAHAQDVSDIHSATHSLI